MPKTSTSPDSGSSTIQRSRPSGIPLPCLLLSIPLMTGACEVPRFQGPQIQAPPTGFLRRPDVLQSVPRMFPERPNIHFDAWIEAQWGEFSGMYINAHEGTTTLDEVVAARAWSMENPPDHPMDYGNVEPVEIDGRAGWAWMEMWRDNGLHEVRYHAAIPYDTVTYTVDFTTGDPKFKARPDSIRAIVASFAVGRTQWNWTLVTLATILGALVLKSGWSRLQRGPYDGSRHMTLAKIPVEDVDGSTSGESPGSPDATREVDGNG